MQQRFVDRICIVTGAASGIGRAVAVALSQEGATLAISDRNAAGLEETRAMLAGAGSNRHIADVFDIADAAAIEAYAQRTRAALGDSDYVFNIAGLTRVGDFVDSPLDSFEKIFNVNFWGVVRMSKAYLPQLLETKGGIINISSLFGFIGYPGQAHYCASKFAVRGFNEAIATELEERGVRVTSVHPGGVATAIARNAEVDQLPQGTDRASLLSNFDRLAITSPEAAAQQIIDGAAKGRRRVVVGRDAKLVSFVQRLFPESYQKVIGLVVPKRMRDA
jgi:short-subunit dehydrogenase